MIEHNEGNVEALVVATLFLELASDAYCGTLELARGPLTKRFVFDRGQLSQADSDRPDETIVAALRSQGVLDEAAAQQVQDLVAEKGVPEERVLLGLKKLGPKELVIALRDRTRRRADEAMGWTEGRWQLDRSSFAPPGSETFRVAVPELVHEALRGRVERHHLMASLESALMGYPAPADDAESRLDAAGIGEVGRALLEALDGTRSVWEQCQPQAKPECLPTLFVLRALGALGFEEKPVAAPSREAETDDAPDGGLDIEVLVARPGDDREGPGAASTAKKGAGKTKDGQSDELAAEIEDKHSRIASLDYYALLDVARDARPAEIKRSYLKAAKRFHPDALARYGLGKLKEKAGEVFAAIGKAHTVLSDPAQRRDYDARGGSDEIDVERVGKAEVYYRQAEMMIKAGRFGEAAPLLENAVKLWPEESAYQGALGWALFKKRPPEPERAREHLEKAVALDETNAEALYHLSLVAKKLGDPKAAQFLTRALKLDPSVVS